MNIMFTNKLHITSFSLCFFDCTGADIEPYLPTLMETMLSALNNSGNLKIKELAVSAIGAIGKNSIRLGSEIMSYKHQHLMFL